MTSDAGDPMAAEFDTVAEWTAQVAADLGPAYYVPAACRGSGQPAAWTGCSTACAWSGRADARCRGGRRRSRRLRGGQDRRPAGAGRTRAGRVPRGGHAVRPPVVQADATGLPFATGSADLAWCLGVLCTAPGAGAQLAMLRELRRVVRPGGRIGLLVFLAEDRQLDDPPRGNHFPASAGLPALLGRAGLHATPWPTPRSCRTARRLGRTYRRRRARAAAPLRVHAAAGGGHRAERPHRPAAELRPAHLPGPPGARKAESEGRS